MRSTDLKCWPDNEMPEYSSTTVFVLVLLTTVSLLISCSPRSSDDEAVAPEAEAKAPTPTAKPASAAASQPPYAVSQPVPVSPNDTPSPDPVSSSPGAEPATEALPLADANTSALVTQLTTLQGMDGSSPAEAAEQWRANLNRLVQAGSRSVPAISEFLSRQEDYAFEGETGTQLGYRSARYAMLDALRQIGSPEAVGALNETLQTTAEPREVAVVARSLEELEPETHRMEAVQAALQTLGMAAGGELGDRDMGPVFEVLREYGDASVVPQLEDVSGKWKYYSAITLAQLPNDAGVSALMQMAVPNDQGVFSSGRDVALQMLAQLAGQNGEARQFLEDHVRAGMIPDKMWPYLRTPLTGDQYYFQDSVFDEGVASATGSEITRSSIRYNNQNFMTAPNEAELAPDVLEQRITFVDQLLGLATGATARDTLNQVKAVLEQRALTAVPPPDATF